MRLGGLLSARYGMGLDGLGRRGKGEGGGGRSIRPAGTMMVREVSEGVM